MKSLLFATAALLGVGGAASAQGVAITGSAEMGIIGGSTTDEFTFWNDVDVRFTLSGETDNGLTFGARIDLDEVAEDIGGEGVLGDDRPDPLDEYEVFLSGNFGTITMGDTDGAFDWALQDLDIIGDIADRESSNFGHTAHSGYSGYEGLDGFYDGQIARYDYSFGDFAFAVSVEIDDATSGAGDPVFGIGGKYSGDLGGVDLGIGLGYQVVNDESVTGIGLDLTTHKNCEWSLNYTDFNGVYGRDSHIGVGFGYEFDAYSIRANYGQYTLTGGGKDIGFGAAASYDLGGGVWINLGVGQSQPEFGEDRTDYSLGLRYSFGD